MNYKVKGIGLTAVLVASAVGVVVGAAGMYWYMHGRGGGLGGDEEGSAVFAEAPTQDVELQEVTELLIEETTEETTEPFTLPDTENMDAVEIIVSGNGYLYRDMPVSLEALSGILQTLENEYTIKVTDQKASLKAYHELITLLEEMQIDYIETTQS